MIWTQLDTLLQTSVAVQVRVIVADRRAGPARLHVRERDRSGFGSQLSVAVAVPVIAGSVGVPHGAVKSGGQVITGGVVSFTVMICVQVRDVAARVGRPGRCA